MRRATLKDGPCLQASLVDGAPTHALLIRALSVQVNMKADLREIYGAPTRAIAEAAIDENVNFEVRFDR
jgi:hypothetical protein